MMNAVKEALARECDYRLDDVVMSRFLGGGELIGLRRGEILIHAGEYDPDIYIVVEGVIRHVYMDGDNEHTATFALPPTMFMEYHCFYAREPSFYQVEACCHSVVLRIPKRHYDVMLAESCEFVRWALSMADNQFYFYERKNRVVNGNARERFDAMIRNRPEIMENVPLRIIASYLGITPQYLSKLKNAKSTVG